MNQIVQLVLWYWKMILYALIICGAVLVPLFISFIVVGGVIHGVRKYKGWRDSKLKKEELLIEKLAEYIHDIQWSGWMRYLFGNCKDMTGRDDNHIDLISTSTIPTWACERWSRQMQTSYKDLSETEKMSDKLEAKRILDVIKNVNDKN